MLTSKTVQLSTVAFSCVALAVTVASSTDARAAVADPVCVTVTANAGNTGRHVPNAEVRLLTENGAEATRWRSTDPDGALFTVKPDRYKVEGKAPGWEHRIGNRFTVHPAPHEKLKPFYMHICNPNRNPDCAERYNLTLDHVEASQVTQDALNQIPLVEDRLTLIRAFVIHPCGPKGLRDAAINGWTAVLRVFANGAPVPQLYWPLGGKKTHVCDSTTCNPEGFCVKDRGTTNLDDTVNWLVTFAKNDVVDRIEVEVNPCGIGGAFACMPETDRSDNILPVNLTFECRRPLRVRYTLVENMSPAAHATQAQKMEGVKLAADGASLLRVFFPVPAVRYRSHGSLRMFLDPCPNGQSTASCWKNHWLARLDCRARKMYAVQRLQSDALVAFYPHTPQHTQCLPWGHTIIPGGTAPQATPAPITMVAEHDRRHRRSVPHELGHLFGLPENRSNIESQQKTLLVGTDLRTPNQPSLIPKNKWDLMRQGPLSWNTWVKTSTYRQLITNTASKLSCSPCTQLPPAGSGSSTVLYLNGVIDPSTDTAEVYEVMEVPSVGESVVTDSGYAVQTFDLSGTLTGESGLSIAESVLGDSRLIVFEAYLPYASVTRDTARIAIMRSDSPDPIGELVRSANVPELTVLSPNNDVTISESIWLNWESHDNDGDPLVHTVEYSPDAGTTRELIAWEIADAELYLDVDQIPGSFPGQGILYVTVSDGFNESTVEVSGLTIGSRRPPQVTIMEPETDVQIRERQALLLQVQVSDSEDEEFDKSQIEWRSDIDGLLGNGREVVVDDLTQGTHTIEVTGSDSDGMQGTDIITVEVIPQPIHCYGDLHCDGMVGIDEFAALTACLGKTTGTCVGLFDLDGDGDVDLRDFAYLSQDQNSR